LVSLGIEAQERIEMFLLSRRQGLGGMLSSADTRPAEEWVGVKDGCTLAV